MQDMSISLNKYISSQGICSRRMADKLIEEGRVTINGKRAKKGNRVNPGDKVILDGQNIKAKNDRKVYLAFNKPPGITCTTDQRDKDNIIDYINYPKRIFPIGRLDKASSGLILLTNDGDIVNQILREENNHEKEYIVKLVRPFDNHFIKKMSKGLPILGTVTKPCKIDRISARIFSITLTQGLNRQIRRMCEHLDHKVMTLKRIRIMNIEIDNLKSGQIRKLSETELEKLKQTLKS